MYTFVTSWTASIKDVAKSSAIPQANFEIMLAVAGATIILSAHFVKSICWISFSSNSSKVLVYTLFFVNVWKGNSVTNFFAFSVKTTLTSCPFFTSELDKSIDLYAAIPPETISKTFMIFSLFINYVFY